MYLTRVRIRNIRSIEELEWSIEPREAPGWHVLVGDNGSGKSTFLRAVAMTLVEAAFDGSAWDLLRQKADDWLRRGATSGRIDVRTFGPLFENREGFWLEIQPGTPPQKSPEPLRGFLAAYGPFRRFSGGNDDYKSMFVRYPQIAPCLSVFDEGVALTPGLEWLRQLKIKKLDAQADGGLLEHVRAFVNSGELLPQGVQLVDIDISTSSVTFKDTGGVDVPVQELSDGYRSMLSLTLELLRQLTATFGVDQVFSRDEPARVVSEGVVLIDEIDAHLHPTWQRRVGLLLRQHFPRMQFIVTSHSPLVCQAADVGSVFLLPRPGSGEGARRIVGTELERLVNGSVLDAYGTEIFGRGVERSDASRQKLDQLAALNVKERRHGLTAKECEEQQRLRAVLPSEAYDTRQAS